MSEPTPREIARRHTNRAFSILRVAAGLAASADADVARMGRQVQRIVGGVDLENIGRRELNALLAEIDGVVTAAYGALTVAQVAAVRELLTIEATWAAGVYGGREVSETALSRIVRDLLVLGAPLEELWARQGEGVRNRILDIIRDATQTPGPIRDAINEAIAQARQGAQTLAETGAQAAGNTGHAEAARRNGAVAYRWVSVLDGRTTTGCAIRNGLIYTLDYEPVAHSVPIERPPPRHFGCRSILIGLLRMPREGDVDFDQTFEQWMGSLSPDEQDDVLGKGKADLFRRGVITKRDLVDQRGRELTLRELRGRGD